MRALRGIGYETSVQALRERAAGQEWADARPAALLVQSLRPESHRQASTAQAAGPEGGCRAALRRWSVMNRKAKLLGVSTPTIQVWLEQFAQAYAQKPEPEERAVVIELDEMWHYLKKVRAALDLEGLGSCFRAVGGLGMRRS